MVYDGKPASQKILIVDDNPDIHKDFQTILQPKEHPSDTLSQLEKEIFGAGESENKAPELGAWGDYHLEFAHQGEAGYLHIQQALEEGEPFALAFVDMRMPPGWDGLKTIEKMWSLDPRLQIIICTAYSDFSQFEIVERLGRCDNLLILKKPFDPEEVAQMTITMLKKREMTRRAEFSLLEMESLVAQKTETLARSKVYEVQIKEAMDELLGNLDEGQNKLIQSEKLASIGHLANGVAHEINNPLGFIHTNLKTLTGYFQSMDALVQKYMDMVDQLQLDHPNILPDDSPLIKDMTTLIENEDLDFIREDSSTLLEETLAGTSRIQEIVKNLSRVACSDSPTATPYQINEGIEATLALVWKALKSQCHLETDLTPLSLFNCIPCQINQVFTALLMNAVQATEDKGRVMVRTWEENQIILFEISDTGKGIHPENQQRVFDPFFTTKPTGEGTGLGLSVAQSIIHQHGGSISLRSTPGQGTTFTVALPLPGLKIDDNREAEIQVLRGAGWK